MRLEDLLSAFEYKISDGTKFCWDCFPDARYLDFESEHAYGGLIFNTVDQTVYQAEVIAKEENAIPYRWIDEKFVHAYKSECATRGVTDHAWDDVNWTEIEYEEDILDVIKHVFFGKPYDGKSVISLEVDRDELFNWMLTAHEQNITLNQFVENALRAKIDEVLKQSKSEGDNNA